MTEDAGEELARLRAENARLIRLLDTRGIASHAPEAAASAAVATVPLSTNEKVVLFRRLFRGRTDAAPGHKPGRVVKSRRKKNSLETQISKLLI